MKSLLVFSLAVMATVFGGGIKAVVSQESESVLTRPAFLNARMASASLVVRPNSASQLFPGKYLVWSDRNNGSFSGANELNLFAIDQAGSVWSTMRIGFAAASCRARRIIATKDGGYAMLGILYGIADVETVVIKVGPNLGPQWAKDLVQVPVGSGLTYYSGHDIKELANGDFIVAGFVSLNGAQPYNYDFAVTRLDAAGNIIWSKHYGKTTQVNKAFSIIESKSGDLYVTGSSELAPGQKQMTVMKLNALGQEIWTYGYGTNGVTDGAGYCIERKTSMSGLEEFYVSGYVDDPNSSFGGRDIHLVSIDDNGALLSSIAYGTIGDEEAKWIAVMPSLAGASDDLYVTGYTTGGPFGGKDAFLMNTLDTSGLKRFIAYGNSRDDYGSEIQIDSKRMYMVGQYTDYTQALGSWKKGYLVSFDLQPNQRPKCGDPVRVAIRKENFPTNNLKFDEFALPVTFSDIKSLIETNGNLDNFCGSLGQ